jgi:hypothetical protein
VSLFREVFGFFFEFFKFCLFSLSFFGGKWVCGTEAQEHNTRRSKSKSILSCVHHRAVLLGIFLLFFWGASPHNKEKEYIKTRLSTLSGERARDKNAPPLFDEMMRTTTTEKASLCVSCFSSLQRKKKTKKEVRLSVSLRSYTVSCNVILLSRFLSLSFSVSLSLWNDGTDF